MIAVPPLGIAFFFFGTFFWLMLVIYKAWQGIKKPNQKTQVPRANPISREQQIEDAAQQIIDGLGLLQKSEPLYELLSHLVNDKLLSHLESKLKNSDISAKQVIDAVERKLKAAQSQQIDKILQKAEKDLPLKLREDFVKAKVQLARPIRANDFHAGLFIERQEMIEITNISGRIQIYMVGKEGDGCHCFRLKSNPDIIKVRRYSTEYPYDLIHTQRGKHSQHPHFQQVSLDKKTNTEKTTSKTLISWRLFERQWKLDPKWLNTTGEYEDVYFDTETYRQQSAEVNQKVETVRKERQKNAGVSPFVDDVTSEKQWVQELAAKKRRESD